MVGCGGRQTLQLIAIEIGDTRAAILSALRAHLVQGDAEQPRLEFGLAAEIGKMNECLSVAPA
jgi:hypothetical protein